MTYQVNWDNFERTVIRTELSDKWTWEEYHTAVDQAVMMMKSVSHTVDLINVMMPESTTPNGNPIPHIQRAMRAFPANHRLTINVGSTIRGAYLQRMFRQMFPWLNMRFFSVRTMEEAREIIGKNNADATRPKTASRR